MQQKRKRKRKKGSNNYFGKEEENAIVNFQDEIEPQRKKEIYVKGIQPAFDKLAENIIFVYKFHNLEDINVLKNDCISFLFENLNKFDRTRGHKAFSYFGVIAKHWFIQKVKQFKKKSKLNISFDRDIVSVLERNNSEAAVISYEDLAIKKEFLSLLRVEIEKWRDRFCKPQERKVLEAIILLLKNPEVVPIYNKKGIYLYMREITGLNTKQIATHLVKLKKKYYLFKKKYHSGNV